VGHGMHWYVKVSILWVLGKHPVQFDVVGPIHVLHIGLQAEHPGGMLLP